jgi:SAM-dependent methyltransferase
MSDLSEEFKKLSPAQRTLIELYLKKKQNIPVEKTQDASLSHPSSVSPSQDRDEENLVLSDSIESVEKLNAKFYGEFPYPRQPQKFAYLEDPYFETVMLNQSIGDWSHRRIPRKPEIWVAGCGTNQAIETALSFPNAAVLGSDISRSSLDWCRRNTQDLKISNLHLQEESINAVEYWERFDYIICTGVIHHNADPSFSLNKLASALKPSGIIELMVYNRYHWIEQSAFQKAIRLLGERRDSQDFKDDLLMAKKIIEDLASKGLLDKKLSRFSDWSEEDFADQLLQPVVHSYTIESLSDLCKSSGLELLTPCVNLYSRIDKNISWNFNFKDSELQKLYGSLADAERWQITNLLLHRMSPMLWFYLQRADSPYPRKSEGRICEEFLDVKFKKTHAVQKSYIRNKDGKYKLSPTSLSYPLTPVDPSVKSIYDLVNGRTLMRDIFCQLGIESSFQRVNPIRIQLTMMTYPYLVAGLS